MVVFGQSGSIRAKVVVFGRKWLYSGRPGFVQVKLVAFRRKWLYSAKVVVFGQK